MKNIAIIGAGLAGLTIANNLKSDANITVFEKARGVSGRMTTRYADPYFFDHGAQYFTVKTKEFTDFIQPMIDLGIIKPWHADFVEIKDKQIIASKKWNNEYKHYVGSPRMNVIAQHLAKDLDVQINTRIGTIKKINNSWQLFDERNNHLGDFDWVVFAIPVDQLQVLLPQDVCFSSSIETIKMDACLSLMLGFDNSISTKLKADFDTAMVHDNVISWVSVNSSKPDRKIPICLLVHSTNEWANKHIDDDKEELTQQILAKTKELFDFEKADYMTLHAWRYANIGKQNTPKFFNDKNQQVSACGDWCIKGRVESAFTSAYELSKSIKQQLKEV